MTPAIIKSLNNEKVGVLPTDTLYGLVGKAFSKSAVEEVYRLKQRSLDKPTIVLISSRDDLDSFGVELTDEQAQVLDEVWPGKVSVILPCPHDKFFHIHRGKETIAFRRTNKEDLVEVLQEVGPLVAPSANPEGSTPAHTIEEAKHYFGGEVDFYIDQGELKSKPSTLIRVEGGDVEVIREGAVEI
ncbi:MAG: L-threonylcarbamoyladenylate synthase [Candidatus Paceibacterota bacterium]